MQILLHLFELQVKRADKRLLYKPLSRLSLVLPKSKLNIAHVLRNGPQLGETSLGGCILDQVQILDTNIRFSLFIEGKFQRGARVIHRRNTSLIVNLFVQANSASEGFLVVGDC